MTASQMKYLFGQLDSIENSLKGKIRETYRDFPCFEDKVEMIRRGEVPLRPTEELKPYTDLTDAYDFTGKGVNRKEIRHTKFEALENRIQELKNSVVFEDKASALEMLAGAKNINIEDL